MRLLFVKSEKIGSKIIRWGTGEPVSHVALEFDLPNAEFIYHSYFTGIVRVDKKEFLSHYNAMASVPLRLPYAKEEEAYRLFLEMLPTENGYDFPALAYFTWRAALKKFFAVPYPRVNALGKAELSLCLEIAYFAADVYARVTGSMILPVGRDLAMMTPWELYYSLQQRPRA